MGILGNWGHRKRKNLFGLSALAGLAADPTPPVPSEAKQEDKLAKDARRVVSGFVAGRFAQADNFTSNGLRLDVNGKPFATRNAPNTDVIRVCPGNVNTVAQRQAANAILTAARAGVTLGVRNARRRKNPDGTPGEMFDSRVAIVGRKNRRGMLFAPKGGCFEVVIDKHMRERAAETFVSSTIAQQRAGGAIPDTKSVAKVRAERAKRRKLETEVRTAEARALKLQQQATAQGQKVLDLQTKPGSDKGRAGRVKKAQNKLDKIDKQLINTQKAIMSKKAEAAALPA